MVDGVNLAGYLQAENGVGQAARLLAQTLRAADVPFSVVDAVDGHARRSAPPITGATGRRYGVNLVCINADRVERFIRQVGRSFFDGRPTIALWHWEVNRFPSSMATSAHYFSEIWMSSSFAASAVSEVTNCPVYAFPLPIEDPSRHSSAITRETLGLPSGWLFYFSFDYWSVFQRKNPLGVVEAFRRAFANTPNVGLLIKSINGDQCPSEAAQLRQAVQPLKNVILREGYCSAEEQVALADLCDCYVSLHRSEGYGLTLAEAMARGKPVICTG